MFTVGTDILEIARIKRHIDEKDRFFERYYGDDERAELKSRNYSAQTATGMFCAKEAFSKALGTGLVGFSLREVQLLHDENGAPYLKLSGNAEKQAVQRNMRFSVSISHTDSIAIATVIGYTADYATDDLLPFSRKR